MIGPNAAELTWADTATSQENRQRSAGIKEKVGPNAEVLYSEGCKITETPPDWDADKVVLGDPALNAKRRMRP